MRVLVALVVAALALACQPPHLIVVVEDPGGLASSASEIATGEREEALVVEPLSGQGFPLRLTLSGDRAGERTVWVEARNSDGVLARGRVTGAFSTGDPETVFVELRRPCEAGDDSACDDLVHCNGLEVCDAQTRSCGAGPPACPASEIACVVQVCNEEERTCTGAADHNTCEDAPDGTPQFCDLAVGCSATEGCTEDGECNNGVFCDGEERCVDQRCVPGPVPVIEDTDPCRIVSCDDDLGLVQVDLDDGELCQLAGGLPGLCKDAACTLSVCGDGLIDAARGERCDDGNDDDTDLCDAQCQPFHYEIAPFMGGGRCEGEDVAGAEVGFVGALSASGNDVYFVEDFFALARRVDVTSRVVSRVAGSGVSAATPDGVPLLGASMVKPRLALADSAGRPYILDDADGAAVIRSLDGAGDLITIVGAGDTPPLPVAMPAREVRARINALALLSDDELLYADFEYLYLVSLSGPDAGIQRPIGGGGSGVADGTPSLSQLMTGVGGIAVLPDGRVVTAHFNKEDQASNSLRIHTRGVDDTWTSSHLAGSGGCDDFVDGSGATEANLCDPKVLIAGALGDLVCTVLARQVVCLGTDEVVRLRAGNGLEGTPIEGAPTASPLGGAVRGIAAGPAGELFISGIDGNFDSYLARVSPDSSALELWLPPRNFQGICGAGTHQSESAHIGRPNDVGRHPDGGIWVSGELELFERAGDGTLNRLTTGGFVDRFDFTPSGELVDAVFGGLYLVDEPLQQYRQIAGGGGETGDGIDAQNAALGDLSDVLALSDTEFLIVDAADGRVRQVTRVDDDNAVIDTLVGTLDASASTEDGPALSTRLGLPFNLARDSLGRILVAEGLPGRIRRLEDGALTTLVNVEGEITAMTVDENDNVLFGTRGNALFLLPAAGGEATRIAGIGIPGSGVGDARVAPVGDAVAIYAAGGEVFVAFESTETVVRMQRVQTP